LLCAQKQLPFLPKAEICNTTRDENPADECPSRIPYFDTIATSRIDISKDITLNAVGKTEGGIGEDSSVGEKGRS
jgi:hypothetical protein